jgi:hypothetical protein
MRFYTAGCPLAPGRNVTSLEYDDVVDPLLATGSSPLKIEIVRGCGRPLEARIDAAYTTYNRELIAWFE